MHTVPVTDRPSPVIWSIAVAALALVAVVLSTATGPLLAASIALASGAMAYGLTVFFMWRQRARRSVLVAHPSLSLSRARMGGERNRHERQGDVWRRFFAHANAWLQAIILALLFGLVLLAVGIPIALFLRVIAEALAWATGTR